MSPDRMSLPEVAGQVDPADILKDEKLETFKNIHHIVPKIDKPLHTVRACHRVKPGCQLQVNHSLLKRQIAVLLPAELVITDTSGKPISGGLFAVQHKVESDRLINDRRPFNSLEHRLGWAQLHHGSLFCQVILSKDQSIRGAGDDLNFFSTHSSITRSSLDVMLLGTVSRLRGMITSSLVAFLENYIFWLCVSFVWGT